MDTYGLHYVDYTSNISFTGQHRWDQPKMYNYNYGRILKLLLGMEPPILFWYQPQCVSSNCQAPKAGNKSSHRFIIFFQQILPITLFNLGNTLVQLLVFWHTTLRSLASFVKCTFRQSLLMLLCCLCHCALNGLIRTAAPGKLLHLLFVRKKLHYRKIEQKMRSREKWVWEQSEWRHFYT